MQDFCRLAHSGKGAKCARCTLLTTKSAPSLHQVCRPWIVASAGGTVLDLAVTQFSRNCVTIMFILLYICCSSFQARRFTKRPRRIFLDYLHLNSESCCNELLACTACSFMAYAQLFQDITGYYDCLIHVLHFTQNFRIESMWEI
jgi:hypothetical protein